MITEECRKTRFLSPPCEGGFGGVNSPSNRACAMQELSALNGFARSWEGEPPGEPRRHPARTEPRPPGITQGHFDAQRWNEARRTEPAPTDPACRRGAPSPNVGHPGVQRSRPLHLLLRESQTREDDHPKQALPSSSAPGPVAQRMTDAEGKALLIGSELSPDPIDRLPDAISTDAGCPIGAADPVNDPRPRQLRDCRRVSILVVVDCRRQHRLSALHATGPGGFRVCSKSPEGATGRSQGRQPLDRRAT